MSAINLNLEPTIGVLFIGVVLSAAILGISTAQTIYYYREYPRDRILLKIMVVILWILDIVSVAMIADSIYIMLIEDHMSPSSLLAVPRSLAIQGMVASMVSFIAHIFLIYRIWMLNHNWVILSIILCILNLLILALGLVAAASGIPSNRMWSDKNTTHWSLLAATTLGCFLDVIITCSICLQLYRSHTGFSRTSRMIHRLMLFTIATGFIPSVLTISVLITYAARTSGSLTYEAISMLIVGANMNTVLVTLNSREFIGSKAADTFYETRGHTSVEFQPEDDNVSSTRRFDISSKNARDTLPLEIYVNTTDMIIIDDTAK